MERVGFPEERNLIGFVALNSSTGRRVWAQSHWRIRATRLTGFEE
jgi:hypothetical protein